MNSDIKDHSNDDPKPAADCGLKVWLTVNDQPAVRKSDADARDAMRLERIAELEADVAKWKALAEASQTIAEISQNSATRMDALKAQEPVAYVTGYYGGNCVVKPLNNAAVLPVNMALYAAPVKQEDKPNE